MLTKIMIVDDHPVYILGLATLINDEVDMEVCGTASDGKNVVAKMENLCPDVMVIDLSLGNYSGLELIKKIRHRNGQVKILVASMHDEKLYAERCMRAGANGYICKEEAAEKIIQAINEVRTAQFYLSPEMTKQLLAQQFIPGIQTSTDHFPEESLSDREMEVFRLIGKGLATKKIANELSLSVKTIETHRAHIKQKLTLEDNSDLIQRAVAWVMSEAPV